MDDHQTDRSQRISSAKADLLVSDQTDTIAAIATPPGAGGVGVIRVSGKKVRPICEAIFGPCPEPRLARYGSFKSIDQNLIDQGLVLFFPGPNSFTGEDVLELHGHGGVVVMAALLKQIILLGARQARPGEFSERAFLNGKIDLLQAEAVADLINSASDQAANSAIRSLTGQFSKQINSLAEQLVALRTLIEAHMDFTEEELEIPVHSFQQSLQQALQQNQHILQLAVQGAVLNEGIRLAIVGPPNVGKSSLLNALLQQDRAIVTATPGTTRDSLTEKFLLEGIVFQLTDTAGLRDTDDEIEQQGIQRSKQIMQESDVLIVMSEFGQPIALEHEHSASKVLYLINKIDHNPQQAAERRQQQNHTEIFISLKADQGLDLLKAELLAMAGHQQQTDNEGLFTARQRHVEALENTEEFLQQALPCLSDTMQFDLAAENLRLAQHCLAEITGEFTSEDLLGQIFAGFCVGK